MGAFQEKVKVGGKQTPSQDSEIEKTYIFDQIEKEFISVLGIRKGCITGVGT
jgi:hypothetical protein